MDYRYRLEHEFLPTILFSDKGENLICSILSRRGAFMIDILNLMGRSENDQCPYKETDYQLKPVLVGSGDDPNQFAVLEIDMPEPEFSPQCYKVFICHDAQFRKLGYFTLEMGLQGEQVLCGWNADGLHLNYGPAGDSAEALFYKIVSIYSRQQAD